MRTTISLDDRLAATVRRRASEHGLSVSAFIARVLDDFVKRPTPQAVPTFRLVTVNGDGTRPGIDLDRPRSVEAEEDEAGFAPRR